MTVTEPQNPAIVFTGFLGVNFHQTEVALTIMTQRMGLGANAQVGGAQGLLDGRDELMMWDGTPALRVAGRGDFPDFIEFNMGGTAMKEEIGGPSGGDNG